MSPEAVRLRISQIVGTCPEPSRRSSKCRLALTPRAKKGLELSSAEADRLRDPGIDTEHLLLGLLHEGEGIDAHILADLGVTPERVREQIARLTRP